MRTCSLCESTHAREVARRIKAGEAYGTIALWLASVGFDIHRSNVGRHARHVLPAARKAGRKPPSTDFLTDVRDIVHVGVMDGEIPLTARDGLAAQKQIDERAARSADHELMMRWTLVLSGAAYPGQPARIIDPENAAIEAEFRPLLGAGESTAEAFRAAEEARARRLAEAKR